METVWILSPPEPDIPVKSELNFSAEGESEYDLDMEEKIEPDNTTESEQEAVVQVKSEPEDDISTMREPISDVWMKNEQATIDEITMELEPELEFGVKTKVNNFMVRIYI